MEDVQIILSGLWVALMLSYLLGDVLRIFAGDFKAGEMEGKKMSQKMLLGMASADADSDCYGFPVPCTAVSCEPMGKHNRSHRLVRL